MTGCGSVAEKEAVAIRPLRYSTIEERETFCTYANADGGRRMKKKNKAREFPVPGDRIPPV